MYIHLYKCAYVCPRCLHGWKVLIPLFPPIQRRRIRSGYGESEFFSPSSQNSERSRRIDIPLFARILLVDNWGRKTAWVKRFWRIRGTIYEKNLPGLWAGATVPQQQVWRKALCTSNIAAWDRWLPSSPSFCKPGWCPLRPDKGPLFDAIDKYSVQHNLGNDALPTKKWQLKEEEKLLIVSTSTSSFFSITSLARQFREAEMRWKFIMHPRNLAPVRQGCSTSTYGFAWRRTSRSCTACIRQRT